MQYRLDKLIICNSTRLALGGKTKIVYTPESPFQLIIGTNSSGKSSLLKELSPLPANLADYNDGGYKEVFITCNNAKYHIRSMKGGHKNHSFVKDGEELNPSGGVTIQRELCQSHFHITEEIHDLLTDNILFTEMSPDVRRKWVTMMHPVDLTFANKVFQNVKTQLRDVAGALKHNESRLNQGVEKLLELETSNENYDEMIADLNLRIEGLYKLRTDANMNIDQQLLKSEIDNFPNIVNKISRNLYPVPPTWLYGKLDEVTGVSELIKNLNYICARNDEEYSSLLQKMSDVAHLSETIKHSEESLIRVKAERAAIIDKMRVIRLAFNDSVPRLEDDFESRLGSLENAVRVITTISTNNNLGELLDRIQRRDKAVEILNSSEGIKTRLTGVEASLASLREMIGHAQHSEDVSCPQCEHTWNMAVGNVNELYDNESKYAEQQQQLLQWISNNEHDIQLANQFIAISDQLKWLAESIGDITLAKKITFQDIHDGSTSNAIRKHINDITTAMEYANCEKSIAMYDKALRDAQEVYESSRQVADVNEDELHARLLAVQENKERQAKQRDELQKFIDGKLRYAQTLEATSKHAEKLEAQQIELVNATFNMIGDHYINQYRSALGVIQNKKTVMEVTKGNVESLKADRANLKADEEALKVLLAALSPKEGIIAEQLYGAIQSIVSDMNVFIEGIWTYDLIIQNCPMENDELSYKFPVMVESAEVIRSDVSRGSSSVKDIINFAFKLLAYKHFDLHGYPLFFDEFGATFDPEHVHRAMMYVQNAYSLGDHSAIFMVSHFENYYSNFSDADINILHTGNIRFEQKHNTCLEIS